MKFQPKLSQQGFILIAVPLAFELLFVGTLFYILDQAQQTLAKEQHSKQIVSEIRGMATGSWDVALKFNEFVNNKDNDARDAVTTKLDELETHMQNLLHLVAGDSAQEARLQAILPTERNLIHTLRDMITLHDTDRVKYGRQSGSQTTALTRDVSATLDQINAFMEVERSTIQNTERSKMHSIELIKELLIFGLSMNVAIAAWLVITFNKRMNQRLNVLVDNTLRLRSNIPLHERLTGNDELSVIDASFHETVESLAEANRLKQQFVAVVSHDLRSPLTSLQMLLSLFAQGYYNASVTIRERSLSAERDIQRLIELINDLIEIDKLESGSMKLKVENTALARIFADAVSAVGTLADQRDVSLAPDDTDLAVLADAHQITRVMVNLLSNAIKFSSSGSTVKISSSRDADQMILVTVVDEGRGIAPESLVSLFDRYSQVMAADEKEGSGLGLAISKQIIEAHGGTIGVESKLNYGSTFWFKLPMAKENGPDDNSSGLLQSN